MGSITTAGARGGKLTIFLGGFGGDNCKGELTDSTGANVAGADITFVRTDGSTQDTGATRNNGKYDIDVDGNVGDSFRVTATWVVRGVTHKVTGVYTIVGADVLMAKDPEEDQRYEQKNM